VPNAGCTCALVSWTFPGRRPSHRVCPRKPVAISTDPYDTTRQYRVKQSPCTIGLSDGNVEIETQNELLEGKVSMATCGGFGIGETIARGFADASATVLVVDMNETLAIEGRTLDEQVDEASVDSFPASDPPPFWGRGDGETARAQAGEVAKTKHQIKSATR
jgi:hypothetical protein